MDPDEALRQLRAAIADYHDATNISIATDAADRIAAHAEALDDWISNNGFLPTAWARPAETTAAGR